MRYNNRDEVESIGKNGTYHYEENDFVVARQMSSFWLCVDPADEGYTPHAIHDGFWEAWVTLWMTQNVAPGSTCVDIGANFGYYTFLLANHGCKVYSFEPVPRCIELLNISNGLNGTKDRVMIENYAVMDKPLDQVKLWEMDGYMMSTIIKQKGKENEHFILSKGISLDKYFMDTNKASPDFIKIDAEGSEYLIWQGMQDTLKKNPNCIVLMEFIPECYKNWGQNFLKELLHVHSVSYVDYNGMEQTIEDPAFFETDNEPFRMIVLRPN